ncbi:hypothetical protein CV102_12245 [Natronococcus pandeyae]|uniref:Uncharacterized protein n=1 Tax=Natronococcus pandeyae TaxID=2055836 RepID=A0A8J8Q506_9EURY|nr:hypothetical protein [Natronococcus pandeyae]TYL38563.1 hypothetical protein CV102_12245 [Natronococcus pandeyae]
MTLELPRRRICALLSVVLASGAGCLSVFDEPKPDIGLRLVNFRESEQTVHVTFEVPDDETALAESYELDGVGEESHDEYTRRDIDDALEPGRYSVTAELPDGTRDRLDYRATCNADDDLENRVSIVVRDDEVSLSETFCGS